MEINAQFQSFVNFAQAAHADGKDKRIARVDDYGALLPSEGSALHSRTIVAASGDKVAPLWRSRANKEANNIARDLFKQAVIDIFGGLSQVPKNVMDAMLMKDYGVGKPLTARRILAVQTEVAKASARFDEALAAAKANCAEVYDAYAISEGHPGRSKHAVPKADLDRLVETAVKTALKDKDALEIVTKRLPEILVQGNGELLSPESVKSKVAEIVKNVEDLRAASAGKKKLFMAGLQKMFDPLSSFIQGNGEAADAIRGMVANKIGLKPGENPKQGFQNAAGANIRSMINWNICRDAKTFAQGGGKSSIFAKDLPRKMKVMLPSGKQLSNDYGKALDELAGFVTNDAKTTFAGLDAKEKNKVYIVASLLSQETGKAAFDGQFTAFDPANFTQPIITLSDQEADEREYKLSFNQDGRLVLEVEATQNLQVITVVDANGRSSTHMTPPGSTAKSNVEFNISANEFERLADLDFTKFDDTATVKYMNQKTGKDKLEGIPGTFAEEFRLNVDSVYTASAIKFDITGDATEV